MPVVNTAQEMFDKVSRHLLTQKEKCQDVYGENCLYRNERNGMRCAIGVLMEGELYDQKYEGKSVGELIEQYGFEIHEHLWPVELDSLARELQFIHDLEWAEDWTDLLSNLAENNGLRFNP